VYTIHKAGAGVVDPALWNLTGNGPHLITRGNSTAEKGRQLADEWLPAVPYDNGIYVVFRNPIGMDDDS